MSEIKEVTERFLRYVKVDTQSNDETAGVKTPSTEKQKNLAHILVTELKEMGAIDVYFEESYGIVYAFIPATDVENKKVLGFIAHMDTSPDFSGTNVKPKIIQNYDGNDIFLGKCEDGEIFLKPEDFPELKNFIGQDLITTDGSTLLGADDKAGVAEIMTMASYLLSHPDIKHGGIAIAFTPDEEVGAGVDHFDLERFAADYAYTVDGGALGELEYENFNAALATLYVRGRSVHTGDAKGKMKNAFSMGIAFDQKLPEKERPEYTEGYEGFYFLMNMQGSIEHVKMKYLIRDHSMEKFEERKNIIFKIAQELNDLYGEGSFEVQMKDQYFNMAEKIKSYMFLIEDAKTCMETLGIKPIVQPIRGGTDGARLSYMGLPCPNLCTGGMNYHGRYEYCSINAMEKIVELLILLGEKVK